MYFETILDKPRFRIGVILHPFRVVLAGKILDDLVKAPLKQYFSFTVAASRTSRRRRFMRVPYRRLQSGILPSGAMAQLVPQGLSICNGCC